jgi:hypothetical protein
VFAAPAPAAVAADDPSAMFLPPADGSLWLYGGEVAAGVVVPSEPGAYLVAGHLVEHRFDEPVAGAPQSPELVVYVPGPARASISGASVVARAGSPLELDVEITNGGTMHLSQRAVAVVGGIVTELPRTTSLVARWEPADPSVEPVPPDVALGTVELAPGAARTFRFDLTPPSTDGLWYLHLDLVDTALGSLAALGSAPGLINVFVIADAPADRTAEPSSPAAAPASPRD